MSKLPENIATECIFANKSTYVSSSSQNNCHFFMRNFSFFSICQFKWRNRTNFCQHEQLIYTYCPHDFCCPLTMHKTFNFYFFIVFTMLDKRSLLMPSWHRLRAYFLDITHETDNRTLAFRCYGTINVEWFVAVATNWFFSCIELKKSVNCFRNISNVESSISASVLQRWIALNYVHAITAANCKILNERQA